MQVGPLRQTADIRERRTAVTFKTSWEDLESLEDLEHLRPVRPDQPVILVADDEGAICEIVRTALEAAGFFVLTAADGEQALQLSHKFRGTIHVVVSDVMMPKLDGLSLSKQLLMERPGIKVLLMSGMVNQPFESAAFLSKPFQVEELRRRVQELL